MLAATLIAVKFNEDLYFDNQYYARVGGVPLEELNFLEREILTLLDYEISVDSELYLKYLNEILVNSMESPPMVILSEKEPRCEKAPENAAGTMGSIKTLPSTAEMDTAQ